MKITNLNNISFKAQKKKYIDSRATGYLSAGTMGLAMLSGISKNKALKKNHKLFSILSAVLIAFHIFSVEFNKKVYKNNK